MSNQVSIAEWARQLSDLIFLGFYAATVGPRPKPDREALPAVEVERPVEPAPRKKNPLSPEVREFMQYPVEMQKQALTYLKKWQEGVSR